MHVWALGLSRETPAVSRGFHHIHSFLHEPFGFQDPSVSYTFFVHIRTGPLLGVPQRNQDTWSRSSPSWYQKDWKSSHAGGDRTPDGSREWSHRHTRGPTSETGGASSSGKKKSQTWERTKDKFLNITSEGLGSLQKILSNKKGSLSQTYKKKTEENAKVCGLNQKTMQALESLAAVAAFEKAGEDLNKGNSECDIVFAESQAAMEEFNVAQQNQERVRGMLHDTWQSLDTAFMDMRESLSKFKDSRDFHHMTYG